MLPIVIEAWLGEVLDNGGDGEQPTSRTSPSGFNRSSLQQDLRRNRRRSRESLSAELALEPPTKRQRRALTAIDINMSSAGRSPIRRARKARAGDGDNAEEFDRKGASQKVYQLRAAAGTEPAVVANPNSQEMESDVQSRQPNYPQPEPSPVRTKVRATRGRTPSPRKSKEQRDDNIQRAIDGSNESGRRKDAEAGPLGEDQRGSGNLAENPQWGDGEYDKTPRAPSLRSGSSAFFQAASTAAASTSVFPLASSASSVQSTSPSKRSRSPVKNVQDLADLERPVRWSILPTSRAIRLAIQKWHPDALALFDDLRGVATGETPFLPAELRDLLEEDDSFEPQPDRVYRPSSDQDITQGNAGTTAGPLVSSNNRQDLYELDELLDITSATINCQMRGRSEPAWNDLVHSRILRLATRRGDSRRRRRAADNAPDGQGPAQSLMTVAVENITRATIAKPFIPVGAAGEGTLLASKMVDYALVLHLDDMAPLRRRLGAFLNQGQVQGQGQGQVMFNQTSYGPLLYSPAGVFVETKAAAGTRSEAQVQLGLWVAAWYKRIEALLRHGGGGRREMPTADADADDGGGNEQSSARPHAVRPPLLPLLLAQAESWELFFACYTAENITIVGPLKLGSSDRLHESFKLVAAMELLVDWVEGPFREWVEEVVA